MTHGDAEYASRPPLIFAAAGLDLPPRGGAALRTHRLLTGLARDFAVTLVTYAHGDTTNYQALTHEEIDAALPGIDVVTVPGPRGDKRLRQLLSLPRRASFEFGRFATPRFRRALLEAAERTGAGVVHFDGPGAALSGLVPGAVNAFAPHNVEHRIIAGTAEAATGARRRWSRLEARRMRREEERLWREADLCVAVSELDAEAMRAGGARQAVVVPNGTDPVDPLPPPARAAGEPVRVLFVGVGNYWPNEHGIAWTVREVLPLVRERTDVVFDVVGWPPDRPVQAPGVTYHGRVADLAEFYERAHVVVAPLFVGSGTRLKVIEAMAFRRPLVSTTTGAEGLPVRPGEHFLAADDAPAFAAAIAEFGRQVAEDDPALATMLDGARAAAEPMFWPPVTERLAAAYRDAARSRRPPRSAGSARS